MLKIKRILKIIILLISIVIFFNISKVLAEDNNIEVRFGEKNMYDAVTSQLPNEYIIDRDESNFIITINQNDIVKIKRLELNDKNILNIIGIEKFNCLEYLNISNNKVSEINDLADLTSLEYLDISNNKISDINDLKCLINLKYLNISNNIITSLDGIDYCTKIEELYAYDNKITDPKNIKELTTLQKLNLSKNNIKSTSRFSRLTNLIELNLSHNKIETITGLKNLTGLIKLNLYDNLIHDLDGIESLENLEELNLGENNEIDPDNNQINNLEKLRNLTKLKKFNFSENNTPDVIEFIKDITTLEHLQLEGNKITENDEVRQATKLTNLTNLKVLNLYNNKVKLIPENFNNLSNLEELYLGSNSLKDLINICCKNENEEYILVLNKLKKLDISNNKYLYTSYGDYEGTTRIDKNAEMIEAIKEIEDTELNYEYLVDTSEFPHYDEQGIAYVTYEDFGAKCDGKYDDYIAIRNAHIFANENGCEVRSTSDKTYHIYKYYENPVRINTSVEWKNATFIIHDEKIEEVSGRYKNILLFTNTNSNDRITIFENELSDLAIDTNTKYIEKIKEKIQDESQKGPEIRKRIYDKYLCEVINNGKKQYIRYGSNADSGNDQVDCFIIDKEGNVLNDIQWDFENITKINLYPIPNEELIIKNGNFISNAIETKSEFKSGTGKETYYERNIIVSNSGNVNILGINHSLSYEENEEKLSGSYNGFLNIALCGYVNIENCELYTRKYADKSTYDLVLTKDVNVNCKKIKSNNIYDDDRWGIIGSNYCKDVVFEEGCELNRIDAHRGIYNLTVKDCTLGCKGLRMTGQGDLNLIGTEICADEVIELRPDYGSTWNGNVNIIDCTYKYDGSVEEPRLIYAKLQYDGNNIHDFGYECKLPNLNIQNLKIDMDNSNNTEFDLFYIDNVKIGGDYKNTEKEENTITYMKQYIPNKIEINGYEFENTSQEVELKLCNNEYMEAPKLEVSYSTKEITNENVKVTIRANKEIQEVAGWERGEDRKTLTKEYTENTEGIETVTVTDLLGNTQAVNVEVNNIDKEMLTLEVSYSTKEITNENVKVTIRANKKIQEVEGWTRLEDGKTLTKVYTENTEGIETVTVTDLLGNTQEANVEVNNIDKEALTLEVLYSTEELTSENVTVTIKANKEIQEVNGWTRGEDRKTLTKVYTVNAKETVTVRDLFGNTAKVNVEVNNIHKTTPIEEDSSGGGKGNDSSESKNTKISTNSSTEKNSILPKTGNRNIIIMLLIIVSVIAIVIFLKYRNMKDI